MRKIFLLFLLAVGIYAVGCGPDIKLFALYSFPDKVEIPKQGDTLRILVIADVEFTSELSYAVGKSSWKKVKSKIVKAEKYRAKNGEIKYRVGYTWKLPNISTKSLKLRVDAVTTKEGRKKQEYILIKETIDSFKPKGKVTFNPFSL